jgi:hypothetical protein
MFNIDIIVVMSVNFDYVMLRIETICAQSFSIRYQPQKNVNKSTTNNSQ